MEPRDLRHLVDACLEAAGLPPSDPQSTDFLVLPLTSECSLGVQWQPDEILLFANVGDAAPLLRQPATDPEDDDDDADCDDDIVSLGVDEHGRWSLHLDAATALATLCLRMPQPVQGADAFTAAVDRFRARFMLWRADLDRRPASTEPTIEAHPDAPLPAGFEPFARA